MRCFILSLVAGLALLATVRAEELDVAEDAGDLMPVEIDLDDDMLKQLLGDLFDDSDFELAREGRAREGAEEEETSFVEDKAVDAKDQTRYNNFVDTFFRRLNSFARTQFDPLSMGFGKSGRSSAKKGKKGGKKGAKKSGKKSAKKAKKGKKGKKKSRHPKDLDLEDHPEAVEAEEEVEEIEVEEHEISKREADDFDVFEIDEEEEDEDDDDEVEEDSLVRVTRDAEEEEEESSVDEVSRRGKPAPEARRKPAPKAKKAKKGKGKKNASKRGGNKKAKKGKNNKNKKRSGGKKGKGKKAKRSASKKGVRTSRATVSGIATLRRDGDVIVGNSKKGGKEMRARFKLGPVDLKVSRKYGSGKNTEQRDARAVSPELTGKLSIRVADSGVARVLNMRVNRPNIVHTEGTLRKDNKSGKQNNNIMEKSINKFAPLAAKKLRSASMKILQASSSKTTTS